MGQAEKRMKVSSTPTLMGRGNEGKTQGKTHVKADAEQGVNARVILRRNNFDPPLSSSFSY